MREPPRNPPPPASRPEHPTYRRPTTLTEKLSACDLLDDIELLLAADWLAGLDELSDMPVLDTLRHALSPPALVDLAPGYAELVALERRVLARQSAGSSENEVAGAITTLPVGRRPRRRGLPYAVGSLATAALLALTGTTAVAASGLVKLPVPIRQIASDLGLPTGTDRTSTHAVFPHPTGNRTAREAMDGAQATAVARHHLPETSAPQASTATPVAGTQAGTGYTSSTQPTRVPQTAIPSNSQSISSAAITSTIKAVTSTAGNALGAITGLLPPTIVGSSPSPAPGASSPAPGASSPAPGASDGSSSTPGAATLPGPLQEPRHAGHHVGAPHGRENVKSMLGQGKLDVSHGRA